ncbi:MAG: heterodisulfide reductase-related iron-sulfur binding cluster [Pseudomonadota bacterium]
MKREGSLGAPTRHPLDWENPDFLDKESLDKEMERQFDVCHGCRRCFNLCGSFPKLFDLVDDSATGEFDSVSTDDYAAVVDDCTLCDMCFLTKCPYVPPHEFNIDFPHLMLRYKAHQFSTKQVPFIKEQLAEVDRNSTVLSAVALIVNTLNKENSLARPLLQKLTHIDKNASIPKFSNKTLVRQLKDTPIPTNINGSAFGQKAVLYATCYGNYNETQLGLLATKILAHLGVEVRVEYPGCCGMPQLELGNIPRVATSGERIARFFEPFIDDGYIIISLIPSCSLMMKSEWPLMLPDDEVVKKLKANTNDISEYIVSLVSKFGLTPGISTLGQDVTLQLACHARSQNIGAKAAEMLRLIPDMDVHVVERCSGHGGTWGMMEDNFELALKVGTPAVRQIVQKGNPIFSSECPLAGEHIRQGIAKHKPNESAPDFQKMHPIEIFARAYGLDVS